MMHTLPLVDPGRVAEMKADLGADILPDLLALFLDEEGGIVASLNGLTGTAAIHALHTLKGSAETMGMAALASACRAAERALKAGEGYAPAEIDALFGASCAAFEAQIRNSASIGSAVMSR